MSQLVEKIGRVADVRAVSGFLTRARVTFSELSCGRRSRGQSGVRKCVYVVSTGVLYGRGRSRGCVGSVVCCVALVAGDALQRHTGLFGVVDEGASLVVLAVAMGLEAHAELGLVARVPVHVLELFLAVSKLALVSVSKQ